MVLRDIYKNFKNKFGISWNEFGNEFTLGENGKGDTNIDGWISWECDDIIKGLLKPIYTPQLSNPKFLKKGLKVSLSNLIICELVGCLPLKKK